jgi:ATP-dependent helicase/nuclease subunit B
MFADTRSPRVFALPPGADFPARLIDGLSDRLHEVPPDEWAGVEIIVNTERMARRLHDVLRAGPPRLLPRIHAVTDIAGRGSADFGLFDLPPERPGLRRRLELAQLVQQLLRAAPELAPASSAYSLADSLAGLLDEMHDENVSPDALHELDVSAHSEHWARALQFLEIVLAYGDFDQSLLDPAARMRLGVETLIARWKAAPPTHPVLLAGSSGSRSTTARLMDAVALLPQGAVILPGFDFDQPQAIWDRMAEMESSEDHPQDRLGQLLSRLDLRCENVKPWTLDTTPVPPRNRLMSLALRPAPVTDQWRSEGPELTDIPEACTGMTLLEASSPRAEATAIAFCLRRALAEGKTAALVTPDRMLTRQVTAALDRWRIEPDDSAGRPLALSAPGRFLRQVADLAGAKVSAEDLIALLKHPLASSVDGRRGDHLRRSRLLEMWLRRRGPSYPTGAEITAWASSNKGDDTGLEQWSDWITWMLERLAKINDGPLSDMLEAHISLTECIASGAVNDPDTGELWREKAGETASKLIENMRSEAPYGGPNTSRSYADLLTALLQAEPVRDAVRAHPQVMIWGTLEARVQGADIVILGGLNDGVWPSQPTPDPWLNRQMRRDVGLTLPDRRIGLQAHDFQQAIAAKTVIMTRARRDADAETVPSRWINRLTNLLTGLGDIGTSELASMRARGDTILAQADAMEVAKTLVPPAPRPEPIPPPETRPRAFSFTDVEKLRRDPYHIYARHILRLRPLDDLRKTPDARLRGQVLHKVFEVFTRATWNGLPDDPRATLMQAADQVLAKGESWTAAERQWRVHLDRIADGFVAAEAQRRQIAQPFALEKKGERPLPGDGRLHGRADRFDMTPDGQLLIYDYKSGAPPSAKIIDHYNRQLHLEAAVAEVGGFTDVPAATVAAIAYIGLHKDLKTTEVRREIDPDFVDDSWAAFLTLYDTYLVPTKGYLSRRAVKDLTWGGDYDHLARYGEWDDSTPGSAEEVA